MSKIKIALAMIVKGSDEEAGFLDTCLSNVSPYVDGIFLTSTYKSGEKHNELVDEIGKSFGATMSYFEWVNDFAKARNFNFSQVPKEYDFILWCDADDAFGGIEKMHDIVSAHPEVDQWQMQYYYERDQSDNPTVVHTKSQIIRNDGSVSWTGRLHEDFKENRSLNVRYTDEMKRIHMTNASHVESARKRNLEISLADQKDRPNDPRADFNVANSYLGLNMFKEARDTFLVFLNKTASDAEKYLVLMRLGFVEGRLGMRDSAIERYHVAIGMFPHYPDAYHQLGYLYYDLKMYDKAEFYLLFPLGIRLEPKYHELIVYNPRDYDYNPMMALAKVYFKKSRPDLALPMLEGCLKIYPDDKHTKQLVEDMKKETERLNKVVETAKYIETLGNNREKILYEIGKLPKDLQSHPAICRLRNLHDSKTTSSGKDIAYYCGDTQFEWNPELFKIKGFGGSEEAVINLTKQWKELGYNVTVYNSCGIEPKVYDGVTYKPWWHFNPRDKWDYLILWRSPVVADLELNAAHVYVDLHDVVSEGEFTEKRLKKIEKIFVKTQAHRALFPNIKNEKFEVIPNGMDFGLFNQDVKRDPFLLINTSSPDRSMDVLPKLFKEVKKQVPQARLKYAYGWDNFNLWYGNDKQMLAWRDKLIAEMKDAGIEDCGRLSQKEVAKLYLEGSIMAYPSDFYEIDCISIKKAQACDCVPVTTDFAAFKESNAYGIQVHSDRTIENWTGPYQYGFGTKDEKAQKEWVKAVVKLLNENYKPSSAMKEWSKGFAWPIIAKKWANVFK